MFRAFGEFPGADLLPVSARLKGFDRTTVCDIADAVGMRTGSPFYHFKNKQEILAAVMEEGLVAGLAAMERIVASELAPQEKFRALVRSDLETVLGDGQDFIPVLLYAWRTSRSGAAFSRSSAMPCRSRSDI